MKFSFLRGRLAKRGWEYRDSFPTGLRQYVLVFGPHTHSRDFWTGLCIREDLGLHHLHVLGKKPLFRGIQGWFLRQLGESPSTSTPREASWARWWNTFEATLIFASR